MYEVPAVNCKISQNSRGLATFCNKIHRNWNFQLIFPGKVVAANKNSRARKEKNIFQGAKLENCTSSNSSKHSRTLVVHPLIFFSWVFRGENMPGKFLQALLFRRQKIPPHLLEKPYIHWHLLRTKLAKMLGNSEWNSRLTENSPSCFPGGKMFMSKKSGAKIDLNFIRPSLCTDKKWKDPMWFEKVIFVDY